MKMQKQKVLLKVDQVSGKNIGWERVGSKIERTCCCSVKFCKQHVLG